MTTKVKPAGNPAGLGRAAQGPHRKAPAHGSNTCPRCGNRSYLPSQSCCLACGYSHVIATTNKELMHIFSGYRQRRRLLSIFEKSILADYNTYGPEYTARSWNVSLRTLYKLPLIRQNMRLGRR